MKKNKNTDLVRYLIDKGISQRNAYRIINESKGIAANLLRDVLRELLTLRSKK